VGWSESMYVPWESSNCSSVGSTSKDSKEKVRRRTLWQSCRDLDNLKEISITSFSVNKGNVLEGEVGSNIRKSSTGSTTRQ
jgi:hypothetical protein